MPAKMTAEAMVLAIVLLFTSSVQPGVLVFLLYTNYPLTLISAAARTASTAYTTLAAKIAPMASFRIHLSCPGEKVCPIVICCRLVVNGNVMLFVPNPGKDGAVLVGRLEANLHADHRC